MQVRQWICRCGVPKDRLFRVSRPLPSYPQRSTGLNLRPFIILIFSTVFLVATLIGAVSLLMTIGDTKLPSTLNLAIGGPSKRD